jgi:hypothetical protein
VDYVPVGLRLLFQLAAKRKNGDCCLPDLRSQRAPSVCAQDAMTADEAMRRIDDLTSHVWMVRTFIKHSDEAADDEELAEVHRELYDFAHALGPPLKAGDAQAYLKTVRKKFSKLKAASEQFAEIQPEISSHTNFQMATQSLRGAVEQIRHIIEALPTS